MENQLEKRVNKLEGVTGKLALLANNLHNGQSTLVEVLQEITGDISSEIREQVSIEMVAQGVKLKQDVKQDITDVKQDIETVKDAIKETTIDRHQEAEIKNKIAKRTKKLVGEKGSPKYILFYAPFRGRITNLLKDYFTVSSYKDISIDEYKDAMDLIGTLTPEDWFEKYILDDIKNKSKNDELKVSQQKALIEYLKKYN